jgi:hypothetical protein
LLHPQIIDANTGRSELRSDDWSKSFPFHARAETKKENVKQDPKFLGNVAKPPWPEHLGYPW